MSFKEHLIQRMDIYLLLVLWAVVGAFLPGPIAIGFSVLTYLLVLRTMDLTKIFIMFLAMLIFSDSRSLMFSFAETAKIIVVIITVIFFVLNFSSLKVKYNDIFRCFLPFLGFSVLATIWSYDAFTALQKSISYGMIFFLIPLFYANGRAENKSFGMELVYFFAVILALGLVIHAFNPYFTTLVGRYRGLLGNPNGLGIFLTVLFAVVYPIVRRNPEDFRKGRFNWFLIIIFLMSLIMTGSRTALIAIGLFFVFDRMRSFSNIFTVIVFIALILSYEYLILKLPMMVMIFGLEDYFRIDTLKEGSGRFVAWGFAWERIQEVFFVGGGFSFTEYIYSEFYDELSLMGHQGNAHNSYLTLWLDTGLIGILLFSLGVLRSVGLAIRRTPYALAIFYAVAFTSFFESWLAASLNPFTSLFIISLTILASPPDQESVPDVSNG